MARRLLLAVVILAIGGPILVLFIDSVGQAGWSRFEWDRLATLAGRTMTLLGLVAFFTIPSAILLSVLIGGTNLTGRRWVLAAIVVTMAIPIPLFAVAWQSLSFAGWRPFDSGVVSAAIVHSLAGLPWVTAILVLSIATGDSSLVDDSRIATDISGRLFQVILPKMRTGLILALVWLLTTVAAEIAVTDLMQVRTFAEEVYTQFVSPAPEAGSTADVALSRAITISIPSVVFLLLLTIVSLRRSHLVSTNELATCSPWVVIPKSRQWIGLLIGGVVTGLLATPLFFLVFRAGSDPLSGWSTGRFYTAVHQAWRDIWPTIVYTLFWSLVTGIIVSICAATLCWWGRTSLVVRYTVFLLAAIALVVPGPIVGLGLKVVINWVIDERRPFDTTVFRLWLYDGPSYLPVVWAWFIRSFPLAIAVLWPVCREWPDALPEATRMVTPSSWTMIRHVFWPIGWRNFANSVLLVTFVCFGEVSASRLTATPGAPTFAHDLFERMHFGLRPDLAACALLGIVGVSIVVAIFAAIFKRRSVAS